MPPRRLLVLAAFAAGLIPGGAHSAAPPSGPYAAGEGRAFAFTFEFAAVRTESGSLRGRGTFRWARRPRGSIEIRFTCLSINGKTAVVGGTIVRRTGRRVPKRIRGAALVVEDRTADRRADRVSRLRLSRGPARCESGAQTVLNTVRDGDVTVEDGKS